MRNDIMKWLGAAILGLVPVVCMAQATVGDMSQIQGETLILKAKANREAARADLDARARAAGGYTAADEANVPVVKSVYGSRDTYVATLVYPNGTSMEAKAGDTLNGGFKVAKVSVDRVELVKNKKVIPLTFSATSPSAGPANIPASLPGAQQPFIPPLGR